MGPKKTLDILFEAQKRNNNTIDLIVVHDPRRSYITSCEHRINEADHTRMVFDLPYSWKKVILSKCTSSAGFAFDVFLEDPSGNKITNERQLDDLLAKKADSDLQYDKDLTNFKFSTGMICKMM